MTTTTKTAATPTAETLATHAAQEAIKAGGERPFDCDGGCLLPDEASDADYEWLQDELKREPTDEEWTSFCETYARWMRQAIDEATAQRDAAIDPMKATSLADLLTRLHAYDRISPAGSDTDTLDLSDLPTFGGATPADTKAIWSWDEKSLLRGSCISDMTIVARE